MSTEPLPLWCPLYPWSFVDLAGKEHTAKDLPADEMEVWEERFRFAAGKPWIRDRTVHRLARRLFPLAWAASNVDDGAYLGFVGLPDAKREELLAELFRRWGLNLPSAPARDPHG